MKRKSKITIDDLQHAGLNTFQIIQQLVNCILDNALIYGEEETEFLHLIDLLSDENVKFQSEYYYGS